MAKVNASASHYKTFLYRTMYVAIMLPKKTTGLARVTVVFSVFRNSCIFHFPKIQHITNETKKTITKKGTKKI